MSTVIHEGDVVALRLGYRSDGGDRAFNILHYRLKAITGGGGSLFPGLPASTGLPQLIAAARLTLPSAWAEAASVHVKMTDMTATSISPAPRSRSYTATFSTEVPGLILGDMLPLQDAPTLLKRTEVGNRWGLGRLFFVGVAEASQDQGILTEAWEEQLEGFTSALEEDLTFVNGVYTLHWEPVLYSKTPPPVIVEHVTTIIDVNLSDRIIKTQRRRRPGKGI